MSLPKRTVLRKSVLSIVALSALSFLIACSSSSNTSTPPPSGGFSNSDFKGTYTFSITGSDVNSVGSLGALTIAGTITAGGDGTLSAGNIDITDTTAPGPNIAINASASNYSVSSDGTGKLNLSVPTTSNGNVLFVFAFGLTDSTHGVISEYDNNGTGSGTIDLQPNPVVLATTPYAFSLSGSNRSSLPLSAVGTFTLSSNGTIAAGVEDYNDDGSPDAGLSLTGAVTVGAGTAPGAATLVTSFGTLAFDVYAIDATHLKLIESDGQAVLAGDVYTGSSSMPSGTLAFTAAGLDPSGAPFAAGGFVSSDGASNLSSGAEDINDAGTVDGGTSTSYSFGGTFVASPSGSGRYAIGLSGFVGGTNFAAYPSSGGVLLLEIDNQSLYAATTAGAAMAQSPGATGLAASQGWVMNQTGFDIINGTELDQVAQFDTTSSNLTSGAIFLNDFGFANPSNYNLSSSSAYAAGGTSSSTGLATLNFNGSSEQALYYAVSSSSSLVLSTDSGDVSVGSFQLQSAPSSASDMTQRHLAMLKASIHKNALKRKSNKQKNQ